MIIIREIEATRSCKDTCISIIYERNNDNIFNFLGAIFGVSSREFHSWAKNIIRW